MSRYTVIYFGEAEENLIATWAAGPDRAAVLLRSWLETIEQGIEVLTGLPAGERGSDGTYPEKTIHGAVERRLEEIRSSLKPDKDKEPEKD